jgi:hydroxymethylglutaryl-CoA reductase
MPSSRIPGFYRLGIEERRRQLVEALGPAGDGVGAALANGGLPLDVADMMIENAVGTFALPFGVALNFLVNGEDRVIPMVVEEPSVVAAASNAALLARAGGGFSVAADAGAMIGQIQLVDVRDPEGAVRRVAAARARLLAAAADLTPGLCRRGAGPRDVEARIVRPARGRAMVVVHVLLDTGDAMGANAVNSLVEQLAPAVRDVVGGRTRLRILSNLADRRLARASVRIPFAALAQGGIDGREVARRVVEAYAFADADPYRAATHNKGIMNGIDAVALATGNDWRGIEAGAHAYAARDGRYRSLSTWRLARGELVGEIALPMAVSTVGPLTESHPSVRLAFRILGVSRAGDLGGLMAAVGLASNLAAMRALATDGIQKGHMALHARAVLHAAGARGRDADALRTELIASGEVKLERARALLQARADGTCPDPPPPPIEARNGNASGRHAVEVATPR